MQAVANVVFVVTNSCYVQCDQILCLSPLPHWKSCDMAHYYDEAKTILLCKLWLMLCLLLQTPVVTRVVRQNKVAYAASKDSGQPGQLLSLIKALG